MDKRDDTPFNIAPPPDLDAKVFAKVAPVLSENKKIYGTKRWFQLWMPLASTAALTAFSFWFLNRKAESPAGASTEQIPQSAGTISDDMDLQTFASMDLDEETLEMANNLDLLEDLELIETYLEDDENS